MMHACAVITMPWNLFVIFDRPQAPHSSPGLGGKNTDKTNGTRRFGAWFCFHVDVVVFCRYLYVSWDVFVLGYCILICDLQGLCDVDENNSTGRRRPGFGRGFRAEQCHAVWAR
jgi:hypothetical protein